MSDRVGQFADEGLLLVEFSRAGAPVKEIMGIAGVSNIELPADLTVDAGPELPGFNKK